MTNKLTPADDQSLALRRPSLQACLFNGFARRLLKPLGRLRPKSVHGPLRVAVWLLEILAADLLVRRCKRVFIGGVACDVLLPRGKPERTVLYLHGGGFMVHAPRLFKGFGSRLATQLCAEVVIPDYRLAPEHPFPAASDDCLAVYRQLLADGRDPRQLIVMGDSAGGNLTLVTLLRAHDESLPRAACAVPLSPAADLTMRSDSFVFNRHLDPLIDVGGLPDMVRRYVTADCLMHRYVSPAFADYSGLPPLAFHLGSTEVLLDSSRLAADAARRAGIETQLNIWPQMPHCFPLFRFLPEAREALQRIDTFVRSHASATDVPATTPTATGVNHETA